MLALNNYLGKGIYIPTEAEATNRILVDYAEGLKRRQDVGFVALDEYDNSEDAPAHGLMACANAQFTSESIQNTECTRVSTSFAYQKHVGT